MDFLWLLLLVLAAAAAGVVVWMRRDAGPARPAPSVEAGDELRSLGLSAARPRSADAPDPNTRRPALPRAEPPAAGPAPHAVLRDGTWAHAEAVAPLLTAFATVLDGPVAVLTVGDGVASVDALAEPGTVPRLPQRRLSTAGTAALREHASDTFATGEAAADALLAFRSAGAAAPSHAAARHLSDGRLIVAGGTLDGETLDLADRFADLLAALAPVPDAPSPTDDEPDDTEAAPASEAREATDPLGAGPEPVEREPDEPETHDDAPETEPTRPAPSNAEAKEAVPEPRDAAQRPARTARPMSRTAMLAREIASSREAEQPLAFALVTRADAETALADGDAETATAALCDALRTFDAVRRAEPFGDLVAGIFLDADALVAMRWTRALADHEPPLHVGLVAPATGDAAEVRADAMQALQDAWTADELVVQAG